MLTNAAKRVLEAWSVPGRSPAYHEAQKRNLQRTWPMMYKALEALEKEALESERSANARLRP